MISSQANTSARKKTYLHPLVSNASCILKLIIDIFYKGDSAKVVGGFFTGWNDKELAKQAVSIMTGIEEYIPGEFYKRELPCILSFLEDHPQEPVELIIIDGYVFLDNQMKKGLGAWLYESLAGKIPIIGVAKSRFHGNEQYVQEITRGKSHTPLYISSAGIELEEASQRVKNMSGDYRLPQLIKQVDTETKKPW